MIFFTADTHFSHRNIIKYCNRSNFVTVEEHDKWLITKWNEFISSGDFVYHLGDFSFASKPRTLELIGMLNGNIYLLPGNHDHRYLELIKDKIVVLPQYYEIKVPDEEMDIEQKIILCHYPIESWNHIHHGAWHLHGHCHGTLPSNDSKARLDVGVDNCNYAPISYESVKEIMTKKVFKAVDHHR